MAEDEIDGIASKVKKVMLVLSDEELIDQVMILDVCAAIVAGKLAKQEMQDDGDEEESEEWKRGNPRT